MVLALNRQFRTAATGSGSAAFDFPRLARLAANHQHVAVGDGQQQTLTKLRVYISPFS